MAASFSYDYFLLQYQKSLDKLKEKKTMGEVMVGLIGSVGMVGDVIWFGVAWTRR